MSSRDAILARIRAATGGEVAAPPVAQYRTQLDLSPAEIVERFASRIADYKVHVERVADATGIAAAAGARFAARGVATLLVPRDLPPAWRPAEVAITEDAGGDPRAFDRLDAVMGGCACAIAETGSIVLDAGAGQGRRAMTLLPDFYLCVVMTGQVVGLLPQAIALLAPAVREGRPITFISGPSATSDIELDRVEGVHGPRTLEVLLVG